MAEPIDTQLSTHARTYWVISQCWRDPNISKVLTFGAVVKQLREIQTTSRCLAMRARAKKLLDDIASQSTPIKST